MGRPRAKVKKVPKLGTYPSFKIAQVSYLKTNKCQSRSPFATHKLTVSWHASAQEGNPWPTSWTPASCDLPLPYYCISSPDVRLRLRVGSQLQASLPAGLLVCHPLIIRSPSSFGVCLPPSRTCTARPCGNQ